LHRGVGLLRGDDFQYVRDGFRSPIAYVGDEKPGDPTGSEVDMCVDESRRRAEPTALAERAPFCYMNVVHPKGCPRFDARTREEQEDHGRP